MKKLLFCLLIVVWGCQPETENITIPEKEGKLQLSHRANGQLLSVDPFIYQTANMQAFGVSKVHYILSKLSWVHQNGSVYTLDGPWFIDALTNGDVYLPLPKLANGNYQFTCTLGLDSSMNSSYFWDNLNGFVGMAWPDPMGGGYHFLKLEGQYQLANQQIGGYAFHLGKSKFAIRHQVVSMDYKQGDTLQLQMQLERWFGPPNLWDFAQQMNHTMTNDSAMQLLSQNGQTVFLP